MEDPVEISVRDILTSSQEPPGPVSVPANETSPAEPHIAATVLNTATSSAKTTTITAVPVVAKLSAKPPVTASVSATTISTAEPEQPFTILEDATAAADPVVFYSHVAIPRPHMALPIEATVDPDRDEDLDRVHIILSSILNKEGDSRLDVTRSLSCAIEHDIAVAAKSHPQACVGVFIGREMKGCGGALLLAKAIGELTGIVTEWSTKIDAVKVERQK
jgi:hypothetical protein